MGFMRITILMIAVLMMPAAAYAEDDDILTISQSGEAGPGIYEITVSGTRDSDTAAVGVHDVRTVYCGGENCASEVTVTVFVVKGKNTGTAAYQKKFDVFLGGGVYKFSFFTDGAEYKAGRVRLPPDSRCTDGADCDIFSVTPKPQMNISLQNATAEIVSDDSFTLRNLACETTDSQGVSQKFSAWGNFRWNPDTLSFELKDAGLQ